MKVYRTTSGVLVHHDDRYYSNSRIAWDTLINQPRLYRTLEQSLAQWELTDDGEV